MMSLQLLTTLMNSVLLLPSVELYHYCVFQVSGNLFPFPLVMSLLPTLMCSLSCLLDLLHLPSLYYKLACFSHPPVFMCSFLFKHLLTHLFSLESCPKHLT